MDTWRNLNSDSDETLAMLLQDSQDQNDIFESPVDFVPLAKKRKTTIKSLFTEVENEIGLLRKVVEKDIYRRNNFAIWEKLHLQLNSEIKDKRKYILESDYLYRKVVYFNLLPAFNEFSPINIDLKITVDNTLFVTVVFSNEIYLDMEVFIFDYDNDQDEIGVGYTIYNLEEDLKSRYCSISKFLEFLRKDFPKSIASFDSMTEINTTAI